MNFLFVAACRPELSCPCLPNVNGTVFALASKTNAKDDAMRNATFYGSLKLLGLMAIILMVIAIIYAGYTAIRYWTGIGV
ncbi:MAG TPA: hypothetical protein VHK70_11215 [Burkholderiaceae bacterium]|nr:hypothetical protein [Burkholderiaceae bacterium]